LQMGKTHHGGDAAEARHFVAAQWLVENLVHGIGLIVVLFMGFVARQ